MRLADFIEKNLEPILQQWESFARTIWRGTAPDPTTLRDHAKEILCATVHDMRSGQTLAQQSEKSKGKDNHGDAESEDVDAASDMHAAARLDSGFYLPEVVAEYRALRASVLRLWQESAPTADMQDLEALTRFNESIDQSLTKGINAYAVRAERNRGLLADEQAARAGAEAANRAKDIFLATLSHEMRTPLTAIVGWAHVLGSGTCSKADLQRGAEVIKRNAEAQARMIDEVLDVSRIVSGKLQLEIADSDLVVLIGAAIHAMRAAADAKNITFTVELDPAARTAAVDPDRIQQVVWNVLSNAVKFTPSGGRVNISLSSEGPDRVIRIVDTGIGIEPEFLPHVFQRFWQVDNGSRRQFAGLGLGLSIVKHLVELHGGVIDVSSGGPGRGSAFTIRLPVSRAVWQTEAVAGDDVGHAAASVASDVRSEPPQALDGLRVLLVEDEADTRDILVRLLGAAGAIVVAASSAAEAMDNLSSGAGNVDVLVSDLGMPGQDGFDLIREVRNRGYDAEALPAIALTAFVGKPDQHRAQDAGFQVHVSKPVDPHTLTAAIARLMGRSAKP